MTEEQWDLIDTVQSEISMGLDTLMDYWNPEHPFVHHVLKHLGKAEDALEKATSVFDSSQRRDAVVKDIVHAMERIARQKRLVMRSTEHDEEA